MIDTSKKGIVNILMRRDGVTEEAAWETVRNCQADVDEIVAAEAGELSAVEDAIRDHLGLEPDFVMTFLF